MAGNRLTRDLALVGQLSADGFVRAGGRTGAPGVLTLVGSTAAPGAPTTGTFAAQDLVADSTGALWLCTVAGTPGTWVEVGTAQAGLLTESNQVGITAGTTRTQAGATALTKQVNRVDTSTSPAVTLAANGTISTGSASITMGTSNTGNVQPGMTVYDNTNGFFLGTVSTYVGTALTLAANALHAGSGSTDSLIFNAGGTLGDGVALPASVAGLTILVINNTTNIIQVYGNGSDTINGVAATTGVPLPPGDVALFECGAATTWQFDAGMGASAALPIELAVDTVCATGTSQPTAFNLTAALNRVVACVTGTAQGVRLPASVGGLDVIVENHSGSSITVYGAGTDTIDDVPTATGVTQMDSSVVIYTCYAAGKWYSNGLATGYAKNPQSGTVLETMQFADGVSAAGTNQGNATQLSAGINTVSTVSAGQGVNLPTSAPGLQVTVINTGANPLTVYAAQSANDTINGGAANAGVALFPGTAATFNCTAAGVWTVQPGTTKSAAYNTVASAATLNLTAAQVTGGAATVDLSITGTTGVTTFQMPTAAAIVAALHAPTVGTSYRLRIINAATGSTTSALLGGSGVTMANFQSGVQTIANAGWREWVVAITNVAAPAVTMTSVATGTWS